MLLCNILLHFIYVQYIENEARFDCSVSWIVGSGNTISLWYNVHIGKVKIFIHDVYNTP